MSGITGLLFYYLLFGGGLVVGVISLIIATRRRKAVRSIVNWSVLAIFNLLAQHSCWSASADFERKMGGSHGTSGWQIFSATALVIGIIWFFALLLISSNDRNA